MVKAPLGADVMQMHPLLRFCAEPAVTENIPFHYISCYIRLKCYIGSVYAFREGLQLEPLSCSSVISPHNNRRSDFRYLPRLLYKHTQGRRLLLKSACCLEPTRRCNNTPTICLADDNDNDKTTTNTTTTTTTTNSCSFYHLHAATLDFRRLVQP
jgi:hypothetical protein